MSAWQKQSYNVTMWSIGRGWAYRISTAIATDDGATLVSLVEGHENVSPDQVTNFDRATNHIAQLLRERESAS